MATAKSNGGSGSKNTGNVAGLTLIRVFLGAFFLFSVYSMLPLLQATPDALPMLRAPEAPAPSDGPVVAPLATPPEASAVNVPPAATPRARRPLPMPEEAKPVNGIGAMLRDFTAPDGLFVKDSWAPFYANFLQYAVHPMAEIFGWLVIGGQALVGLLLLFGCWTRTAAIFAMLMNVAFLLATLHLEMYGLNAFSLGINSSFMVMELALLMANTKNLPGLDMVLRKR